MLQYQQRKQYWFNPKFETEHSIDDLPYARCPTYTPVKKDEVTNVMTLRP